MFVALTIHAFQRIYEYQILWNQQLWSQYIVKLDKKHNHPMNIPKIIHKTWTNFTNIPQIWYEPYQSCQQIYRRRADYTMFEWTDESGRVFLSKEYPWILSTYDSYPYTIQRIDALRYFLVYHYGGCYLDMDIGCRHPIDPLLYEQLVLPKTFPLGWSNDVMCSAPRHPFMRQVIEALPRWNHWYGTNCPTVMLSTGPLYLSLQFAYYIQNTFQMGKPSLRSDSSLNKKEESNAKDGDKEVHVDGDEKRELNFAILPPHLYGNDRRAFFMIAFEGSTWHAADAHLVLYLYTHASVVITFILVFAICTVTIMFARWYAQMRVCCRLEKRKNHREVPV